MFSRVFHKFAPKVIRNVSKNNNKPKWFSNTLKNLISKRNRLHRTWNLNLSNSLALQRYTIQRLKVEKELKRAKSSFYYEKFENRIGDSGQVYRFLDTIKTKSRNNAAVSEMLDNNGCKITFQPDIKNELNIFSPASAKT